MSGAGCDVASLPATRVQFGLGASTPTLEHSDVEPNLWTGLRMGLLSRRDYRTQPGVLTPGTRPKNAPPCLSAVVPGMWDEGGKGRKIGVIDS